jgi:hypothetical protein
MSNTGVRGSRGNIGVRGSRGATQEWKALKEQHRNEKL